MGLDAQVPGQTAEGLPQGTIADEVKMHVRATADHDRHGPEGRRRVLHGDQGGHL